MKTEIGLFGSRFARRLFVVFILSAIIPVLTLAAISYNRVSEQLLIQNQEQQQQEAKSIGLAIYERLTTLKSELLILESSFALDPEFSLNRLPIGLQNSFTSKLRNLGLLNQSQHYRNLIGPPDHKIDIDSIENLATSATQFTLLTQEDAEGTPRTLVVGPIGGGLEAQILIAELNQDFLWNTETINPDQQLCVLDQSDITLFCSQDIPANLVDTFQDRVANEFSGTFEWNTLTGESQLISFWSIFLENEYGIDDWTSLISIPRQEIFQPITEFQNTFVIAFLISILLVLLLSSNQIRRILNPLRILTQGIQEVGNSNFENKVIIESRDEFQDLADSFNTMGGKLSEQFQSLETMAEIDRLILSSEDADSIVRIVLVRIQEIIGCDQIGIAAQNSEGSFSKMYIRSQNGQQDAEIQETEIEITESTIEFLQQNRDGVFVELDHTAPLFLESLVDLGGTVCLVLPLYIDDDLSAIVALSYISSPEDKQKLLIDNRSWADRVGVALSNAKWQEKLYNQANYDALTGLPNRPAFRTYLQQTLNRAQRKDEMIGVLFIDLDRFKMVNDTLGHAAGDDYLKDIADRLSLCVRNTDMLARLGGDEFTIVVSENPDYQHIKTAISAVAEKLLGVIPLPVEIEGQELRSTASIGISLYPLDANNAEELMRNADSAMYHAKANGGGKYHYYSEELNQAISDQLRVENELRYAIRNDLLELYFQPQIDANSEKLLGAESLLRWNHPKAGIIAPDDFIPIAEETNLIIEIDNWVLNAACSQLKKWQNEGYEEFRVAVNLSARFFQQDDVVTRLKELAKQYEIKSHNLELEITEGTLIEDIDAALKTLEALRDLDFVLTIDDFGTGYSSLSYLKKLPIDKLKIDQAFVEKCVTDPVDNALVKTIINMAHNLEMDCIAEGVELEEQLTFLRAEKCNEIQGFYYSKPLPASQFEMRYLIDE
ncbi:MAG: EAL domain-containing protein [Pseudomonadales bacterium]|nr:EAL domain-containing protein [Pseudomonadales bacterium]